MQRLISVCFFLMFLCLTSVSSAAAGDSAFAPWKELDFSTCTLADVSTLVDRGASINAKSDYRNTPLHYFADELQLELVEFALQQGAKVNAKNKKGNTPLVLALSKLKYGGFSPPWKERRNTAGYDNEGSILIRELVRVLIDAGADPNAGARSPLLIASEALDVGCVRVLLDSGARVSSGKQSPLLKIAGQGGEDDSIAPTLDLLLKHGANVNVKRSNGETPIHLAATAGNRRALQALIDHGGNVNVRDKDGQTPVFDLCIGWKLMMDKSPYTFGEILETLAKAGADLDSPDREGRSPLHYSVSRGHVERCTALIDLGADVNARDGSGLTALHRAASIDEDGGTSEGRMTRRFNRARIASSLIDAGGDVHLEKSTGDLMKAASGSDNWPVAEVLTLAGAHGTYRGKRNLEDAWRSPGTYNWVTTQENFRKITRGMSHETVKVLMGFVQPDAMNIGFSSSKAPLGSTGEEQTTTKSEDTWVYEREAISSSTMVWTITFVEGVVSDLSESTRIGTR